MGRNRFREDALKYWDIRCEDAWTRFEEAVRENPYLTAKEFCIKDMGCVDPFMKWTRRTKHSISRLRRQALDERKRAKGLERRNSTGDPTPGNMFIQFVPKKATGSTSRFRNAPPRDYPRCLTSITKGRRRRYVLTRKRQPVLHVPASGEYAQGNRLPVRSHLVRVATVTDVR